MKEKDFIGIDHGKNVVDLRHLGTSFEMRPTEIHLKKNGSLNETDSVVIVFTIPTELTGFKSPAVYGQISIEMFNDGLADIGYKIVKINEKNS